MHLGLRVSSAKRLSSSLRWRVLRLLLVLAALQFLTTSVHRFQHQPARYFLLLQSIMGPGGLMEGEDV